MPAARVKRYSESDAGSMKGYDPNLGLPKNQVPNSGYTPKTGPLAPKKTPAPKKQPVKPTKRYSK